MANKKNEININVVAGPSEMQLMTSLMRAYKNFYRIDTGKATCVHFTTDGKEPTITAEFGACINGMSREDGSGNSWHIEGYFFDHPNTSEFKGYYNSRTRKGYLSVVLA